MGNRMVFGCPQTGSNRSSDLAALRPAGQIPADKCGRMNLPGWNQTVRTTIENL
jgi:hypothetical protein